MKFSLPKSTRAIIFFGPDGTGKTTHADNLLEFFHSIGIKSKRVWIRSPHTLAYLLAKLLKKTRFHRRALNPYGKISYFPHAGSNKFVRSLWIATEVISILPVIVIRFYLPLILGYLVVAERYVIDTIANIAYFIDDLQFSLSPYARFLLSFIPKGSVLIHLDCDYTTVLRRRRELVEPKSFFCHQQKSYAMIKNSLDREKIISIDTSRHEEVETKEIITGFVCYHIDALCREVATQ